MIDRDVVVSQGSDLNQGLSARAFVPTSGKNPTDLLYDDTFTTDVYSIFGQVAYDVMENFEVALALRYDSEDREVENNVKTCDANTPTGCRAQTPLFNFGTNPRGTGVVGSDTNPDDAQMLLTQPPSRASLALDAASRYMLPPASVAGGLLYLPQQQ